MAGAAAMRTRESRAPMVRGRAPVAQGFVRIRSPAPSYSYSGMTVVGAWARSQGPCRNCGRSLTSKFRHRDDRPARSAADHARGDGRGAAVRGLASPGAGARVRCRGRRTRRRLPRRGQPERAVSATCHCATCAGRSTRSTTLLGLIELFRLFRRERPRGGPRQQLQGRDPRASRRRRRPRAGAVVHRSWLGFHGAQRDRGQDVSVGGSPDEPAYDDDGLRLRRASGGPGCAPTPAVPDARS